MKNNVQTLKKIISTFFTLTLLLSNVYTFNMQEPKDRITITILSDSDTISSDSDSNQKEPVVTVEESEPLKVPIENLSDLEPVEPQGPEKIGCCRRFLSILGAIWRKCCCCSQPEGDDPFVEDQDSHEVEIESAKLLDLPPELLELIFEFLAKKREEAENFMAVHPDMYCAGFKALKRNPELEVLNAFRISQLWGLATLSGLSTPEQIRKSNARTKKLNDAAGYIEKILLPILSNSRAIILREEDTRQEELKQEISLFNKKMFFNFRDDQVTIEKLKEILDEMSQRKEQRCCTKCGICRTDFKDCSTNYKDCCTDCCTNCYRDCCEKLNNCCNSCNRPCKVLKDIIGAIAALCCLPIALCLDCCPKETCCRNCNRCLVFLLS